MSATGLGQILAELAAAVEGGPPVVLASVVATEGSVPRHAGAKMVVRADGSIIGTIGGGNVEAAVTQDALAALKKNTPELHHYRLQDPARGDHGVCGGELSVYLEPYMTPHTIYVIGCGHIGKAVVDLAHWLGYRTVAVDDRPELLSEEALPLADVRFAGSAADAFSAHPITANTSVVAVTRSVALDAEMMPLLLDSPAAYIGIMGSARRWGATKGIVGDDGSGEGNLDRIRNPIGLDIGAETVEEIAVSILSEVIASNSSAAS